MGTIDQSTMVLVYAGGMLVISALTLFFGLRSARRDGEKALSRLDPDPTTVIAEPGVSWLRSQLARRSRWSLISSQVVFWMAMPVLPLFHDSPWVRESWHVVHFPVAFAVGVATGETLALVRSASSGRPRRVASLRPRAPGGYARPWEMTLQRAHLSLACAAALAAAALLLSGRADAGLLPGGLVVALLWVSLVGTLIRMQHVVVHAPATASDESMHLARELTVSMAVRSLLRLHLMTATLVSFVVAIYLSQTTGAVPWLVAVFPLYATPLGVVLARHIRRDRGHPDPEWMFATAQRSST